MQIFGDQESVICRTVFAIKLVDDALEYLHYNSQINSRLWIIDAINILETKRMELARDYDNAREQYANLQN